MKCLCCRAGTRKLKILVSDKLSMFFKRKTPLYLRKKGLYTVPESSQGLPIAQLA